MLKWLLKIAKIAAATNVRISLILFVVELLKQFDGSIVNSENQSLAKNGGKAGFVYVIRDSTNGERFKIGHRAKLPSRDRQLMKDFDGDQDFVLIIPAKDALALENRLRRAYAKHSKKGEWFSLENWEKRELMIIAALIKLAVRDDLGMSAVDQEIVPLAAELLKQLQDLASELENKMRQARKATDQEKDAGKAELDLDDFSTTPVLDWNWESVLDEDYRALPKLKRKRGYVSIIRDTGTDRYKTFFEKHPVDAIDAAFSETGLRFALEVILVLEVDNMKKAKEALLSESEHKNGTAWVELSFKELGDMKQSANEDRIQGSVYVSPKSHWGLETLTNDAYNCYPKLEKPAGYICLLQGVKPGNKYKILRTDQPKDLGGNLALALQLNNPHDAHTASKPIKFRCCIIKAEYADSFRSFLHKRYREHKRKSGWFELDDTQLREICSSGKP